MKKRVGKSFGFFKTTAIGGLLFLLPLAVIGVILGYIHTIVHSVYKPLQDIFKFETKLGLFILFLVAILIVLWLCFLCGLITKRALAKKFSEKIEKQVMMVYPKYAIYKDILAGNVGGDENAPTLLPVGVKFQDFEQFAFEADRLVDGRVVVYLPGAPDPWNGTVVIVEADQVFPLEIPFSEAVGIYERLGRNCSLVQFKRDHRST